MRNPFESWFNSRWLNRWLDSTAYHWCCTERGGCCLLRLKEIPKLSCRLPTLSRVVKSHAPDTAGIEAIRISIPYALLFNPTHFPFPTFCRRVIESCAPDTPGWKAPGKDGCTKKECLDRQGAFLDDRCRRDNMTYAIPPPWPKPDLPMWVWDGFVEFGRRQQEVIKRSKIVAVHIRQGNKKACTC